MMFAFAATAFSAAPPAPGEIARYRDDGSLAARAQFMRETGNHVIAPELVERSIYRMNQLMMSEGLIEEVMMAPPPAWKGLPTTGVVKIPVVGIEFSDYSGTYTEADINDVVFGGGSVLNGDPYPYESVTNFYSRSSYGQLTITGNVLGWYNAGVPRASVPQTSAGRRQLIKDALDHFDSLGHDFSQYDNNGDGKIDYIIFIWAGPNDGWGGFWWSYKSKFTDYTYSIDGKMLSVFSWNWESYYELPDPPTKLNPRTLIHETGHALGLPDYYDYDDAVGPDGGVGGLDMMDSNIGDHNAFSKFVLGWITPDIYTSGVNNLSLAASYDSTDAAIIMPEAALGETFYEYFIAQNRSQNGNDLNHPGEGLTIWHVDATLNEAGTNFLYDNSYTDRKLLRLMEADGLEEIEAGGDANVGDYYILGNELSPISTPNTDRYNGAPTNMTVENISVAGDPMTLDVTFAGAFFTVISATATGTTTVDILFNLDIDTSMSAADPANYNIDNGIGQPSSAVALPDNRTIRLTTSELSECVAYDLTISNVLSGGGDSLYVEASPVRITGNGVIVEHDINYDSVWSPAEGPYCPSTDIAVNSGATLTIEPGTVVKFFPNVIGANYGWTDVADIIVSNGGGIIAKGTEANPITFTSLSEAPAPGDWGSVLLFDTALDNIEIAHSNFSYAKYAVMASGKSPIIEFCEFRNISGYGVFADSYSISLIRNNLFTDSYGGIYSKSSITASGNNFDSLEMVGFFFEPTGKSSIVKDNNFTDNESFAVYSQTSGDTNNVSHNYFNGNLHDSGTNCDPPCPVITDYKSSSRTDRLMSPSSLKFKSDAAYTSDLGGVLWPGATLYIQLVGNNGDPAEINTTVVRAYSSSTSPEGIYVTLTETAAGTGVYRGTAILNDSMSDQSINQLGAGIGEDIFIVSVRAPDIGDSAEVQPDMTPPADIAAVNDGVGADIEWTTSATSLSANWSASSDPESGVASYWHAIGSTPGDTDVSNWTDTGIDTFVTRSSLSLSDGQAYYFSVRAENGAGLLSDTTSSNGQTVDSSPPTSVAPVNDGSGADIDFSTDTTEISANWSAATDPHSGVSNYYYSIGSAPEAADIIDWTDNALSTSFTSSGLSLVSGQTYFTSVRAINGAGLYSTATSDGLTIDTSAPSAPAIVNDGSGSDMEFAGSTSELSANWSASSDSESGIAHYWHAIGSTPGDTDVAGWADNGNSTSVTRSGLSLSDGMTYFFTVKSENGAGLLSDATNSNGQTIDTSPPSAVTSVNDGPAADINWATSATSLTANWDAGADPHSGIARYWLAIGTTPGATDTVNWTDNSLDTSATQNGLSLTDGQTYYFTVKAENGGGLMSVATNSNGQTVDSSPPSMVADIADGLGADIEFSSENTELSANWSTSNDIHSGVSGYYYSIGTTPGAADTVAWTDNALDTSFTHSGLSLVSGQTYYISVRAVNGVGLFSDTATSNGITIDTSAPSSPAAVNDGETTDIAFTASNTSLSANWTASTDIQSGVVRYWHAIGSTPGDTDISNWTDTGTTTHVVRSGLSLSNGQTYYFSVRAENGAGLLSTAANSDGQTVDSTPPSTIATVNDGVAADIEWTISATELSANWTASSDPQSGVVRYWHAIGSTPGGDDVSSWTDTGTATAVTRSGLSLAHAQTYYFSIIAENGSGLLSTAANSNGQTVDIMPPAQSDWMPANGAAINTVSPTVTFSTDENAQCRWAAVDISYDEMTNNCGVSGGDFHTCSVSGLAESSSSIYFACVDALGNSDFSASNTLVTYTVDLTPPSLSSFNPANSGYLTSTTPSITFNSNEAAICRWAFDDDDYADMPLENQCSSEPTLAHSCVSSVSAPGPLTLYFACEDSVNNSHSAAENYGVEYFVDTTPPPSLEYVFDGIVADIDIFTDPTQISANWASGSDAESGFNSYTYSIGTSIGLANIVPWISIGTARSVTRFSLPLTSGQTYYFCVRAVNNAGLASTMTCSDGQTLVFEDTTPPLPVPYVYDGSGDDIDWATSTSSLSANWGDSSDPESGVQYYLCAIGASPGAADISPWTNVGGSTSVVIDDLSLSESATYYFSVKAVNGWDLESNSTSSNGIKIDTTPPTAPANVTDGITDDIDWTANASTLPARWSASTDAQSGVVSYFHAVGTSPGSDNVAPWTSAGLSLSATRSGLSLSEGQTYYFSVKAENAAGLMSNTASSDGVSVDLTPPSSVPFVNDGNEDDITFCGSLTQLEANWGQSTDSASGVAFYRYAIGRSPGATDVVSWTSAGLSTSVTRSGLTLTPGQMYYFSVKAVDFAGLESTTVSSNGQTPDIEPPGDVSAMSAQPGDSSISLTWANPSDADFAGVIIVRNQTYYPLNVNDGSVVFDGSGQSYTDTSVSSGYAYYYAAFAYDNVPNYSTGLTSGARATASLAPPGLSINAGWNLIGSSKQSISFYTITGVPNADVQISRVSSTGVWFHSSGGYMDLGAAYWVYSQTALGSLTTAGTAYSGSSRSAPLTSGWNMIASPFEQSIQWAAASASLVCGGVSQALPPVYFYTPSSGYVKIEPNSGNAIVPWRGYMLNVGETSNCVLTLTK